MEDGHCRHNSSWVHHKWCFGYKVLPLHLLLKRKKQASVSFQSSPIWPFHSIPIHQMLCCCRNIEEILKERGEEVKKITNTEDAVEILGDLETERDTSSWCLLRTQWLSVLGRDVAGLRTQLKMALCCWESSILPVCYLSNVCFSILIWLCLESFHLPRMDHQLLPFLYSFLHYAVMCGTLPGGNVVNCMTVTNFGQCPLRKNSLNKAGISEITDVFFFRRRKQDYSICKQLSYAWRLMVTVLFSFSLLRGERGWENVCVSTHVCVCVCVCERDWERERGGGGGGEGGRANVTGVNAKGSWYLLPSLTSVPFPSQAVWWSSLQFSL